MAAIRELVGPEHRHTIAFNRGGLESHGTLTSWLPPGFVGAFTKHTNRGEERRRHCYLLADRRCVWPAGTARPSALRLPPDRPPRSPTPPIRSTSSPPREDDAAVVTHAVLPRWRQENFFRYLRVHYASTPSTATPRWPTASSGQFPTRPGSRWPASCRMPRRLADIGDDLPERLRPSWSPFTPRPWPTSRGSRQPPVAFPPGFLWASCTPMPLSNHGGRKRIHDAIRMAAYDAETALARLLAPHYDGSRTRRAVCCARHCAAHLQVEATNSTCASTRCRLPDPGHRCSLRRAEHDRQRLHGTAFTSATASRSRSTSGIMGGRSGAQSTRSSSSCLPDRCQDL